MIHHRIMKQRYSLFNRNGTFYCEDRETGKQVSLRTKDESEARTLLHAKNEALRQPTLNLQMARTYMAAADPQIGLRTWQEVMDAIPKLKVGSTRVRWEIAIKAKALDPLRKLPLLQTRPQDFLGVLESCGVATVSYLRRIHSFALDMNWLPWPVLAPKRWPTLRFKTKRAVTAEEHQRILASEQNPEWRAFYQLLWHLGGSQSDIATLTADNVDLRQKAISYTRRKTSSVCVIRFGENVAEIIASRPSTGFLFPMLAVWRHSDRAKAFIRRCRLAKVSGVSLHSYRYSWAERARVAGYPERFAQEALGHNSKAVHQAYSKNAQVQLPPLEDFERKILAFPSDAVDRETPQAAALSN